MECHYQKPEEKALVLCQAKSAQLAAKAAMTSVSEPPLSEVLEKINPLMQAIKSLSTSKMGPTGHQTIDRALIDARAVPNLAAQAVCIVPIWLVCTQGAVAVDGQDRL
jgi:hypothetical protein